MKVSYMAIGYACNQKCRFCPCSSEEASYPLIPLDDLEEAVDRMLEQEPIDQLVVSGGEPTIYPHFAEFIRYVLEKGLQVTVLTNSERFADRKFTEHFCEVCRPEGRVQVITTIHSQNREEHEWVNQTKGSFERTSQGLRNLCECGVHVTVKHCITKLNYRDLTKFYRFVDSEFGPAVDIQLCSIDYCGLTDEDKREHEVIFPALEPYFEEMFDAYMEDLEKGSARHMY
ncbi:MAG: radical SAM protein [Clostridiales bacterium]|nr:radical SAM protein [Clostridiales bacterium]